MITTKKVTISLMVLVVLCSFVICFTMLYLVAQINLQENGEKAVSGDWGVYAIDSQTILQDLSQGNKDVFQYLPDGELMVTPEPNLPPVRWTEADYLFVADSFNEHISNDSLQNWDYQSISYGMDCDKFSYGPQQAIYEIVKYIFPEGNKVRLERELWIYPHQDRVEWDETGYDAVFGYSSFKLEQVKISMEDVLKIAEEQGGKVFRLTEDDECRVVLDMIAGIRNDNWQVRYTSSDNQYVIDIDKETGDYQIVEP